MTRHLVPNTPMSVTHKRKIASARGLDYFKFDVPEGQVYKRLSTRVKGRYQPNLKILKQPEDGATGDDQKIWVRWKFEGGGRLLDSDDNPYITYTLEAVTEAKQQRAILVACENTGRFAAFEEHLSDWQREIAERLVDFAAESFETVNAQRLFKDHYDKVVTLIDTKCTVDNIRDKIAELGKTHVLDIAVIGHGGVKDNECRLEMHNGELLTESTVRGWRSRPEFRGLRLGLVYMTACWGSKFNDTWRKLGFATSIGSRKVNSMPEPMFTLFWDQWLDGKSAKQAAIKSWEMSADLWQAAFPPTVTLKPSEDPPFFEVEVKNHPAINASKPMVTGKTDLEFKDQILATGAAVG